MEGCSLLVRSDLAGLSILSDFVGAMLNAGGSRIGVCVGSVNRCEMPMAGRGHLHPQAHRADGQDQSCKRSLLMPERRVQRGSGPEEDPLPSQTVAAGSGKVECCNYFFHINYFFNSIIGSPGKVKEVHPILPDFGGFHIFHLIFFNSIIQVPRRKGEKEKVL